MALAPLFLNATSSVSDHRRHRRTFLAVWEINLGACMLIVILTQIIQPAPGIEPKPGW